ncbi:NAD(P)-dependent dehydrogenase (short-subunit alcohol dehydrogenase family) [Hamadaea flava]|uniref:SDR family NAD(P)-dependent oxidoreductase n=1 Tax=Hamadaea flava TaxID=1742688 RepID=A0ABV8LXG0_9ACTN|nr:SDR family oxidoreductase [Hamadaea flava]MCP2327695.1 NAD(P)-dependent dehydrogenase (short-subunit alcohol dehydrogenase family) [Hamadaea flava]
MNDFAGRVAAITGGASGIGAACAALFEARGATVAVVDLPDGDVSQPLEGVFERIAAEHGGVDILVNSAGISAVGPVEANSDEEWHRVLDVNVVGIVRASRAALPYLKASPHGGVIVNMSSIAATAGLVNRALYSASKGAVHALTLAMAADLVGDGVRVCCVAPGTVDTPWVARLLANAADPAAERTRLAARQPTGRLVTADEVAAAIAYLAGPGAGATTGTSLAVDGGMSGLRLVR